MTDELTLTTLISDPLIALVNEADGVDSRAFAQMMESAARIQRDPAATSRMLGRLTWSPSPGRAVILSRGFLRLVA